MEKKRVLALLMALCMLVFQLPTTVWASTETLSLDYPVIMLDQEITAEVPEDGYAYFQFTPEYTEAYFFYSSDTQGDPYVTLYDSEMNQLNSSDDYNSPNFGLSCTLEAGETYVLQIGSYSGASSFPVKLEVVHSYIGEIVTESSCTENGLQRYTCQYCDNSYEELIPFSHSYGEDGICINCGEEYLLTGVCGENVTWSLNYQGQLTISGSGDMYSYEWGESPFYNHSTITSIVIEEGITHIGSFSFMECRSLVNITLPDTLATIGNAAFFDCSALTNVTIPNSVTSIADDAFFSCNSLKNIEIPASVTYIGNSVFYDCYLLERVDVANQNPNYSNDTYGVLFNKNKSTLIYAPCAITGEYVIPNSVTTIESHAFNGCSSLTSIIIPESVASMGWDVFYGCRSLQKFEVAKENANYSNDTAGVLFNKEQTALIQAPRTIAGAYAIPESVTSIGDSAFVDCEKLTGITIPNGVETIGYSAFFGCSGLTSITIPSSVTFIGSNAFCGYGNLEEVWFNGNAPVFGDWVFEAVTATVYYPADGDGWTDDIMQDYGGNLTWVAYGLLASGECGDGLTWQLSETGKLTISGSGDMSDYSQVAAPWSEYTVSEVVIKAGVESISSGAFAGCAELTKICFEGDAPVIAETAFTGITAEAFYPAGNATWTEDVLQHYGGTLSWTVLEEIIASGSCGENISWKLNSDGLLTVSGEGPMYDYAPTESPFYGNTAITSVIIDEGITYIGSNSFYYCQNLYSVTFSDSVASIGASAFSSCYSLTSIQFGSGLVSIGDSAFSSCGSLPEVVIPHGVVSLGENAFAFCNGLAYVVIPETVETIGTHAFGASYALQSITVAEQNRHYSSDNAGVLFNKDKTQLICTPALLEGSYSIPESVTTIMSEAFGGRTHLTSISIPEGVLTIGDYAFNNCTGLTSIYIPGSVTSIGVAAFADCRSVQKFQVANTSLSYCSDDAGVLFDIDQTRLLCAPGMLEGAYVIPDSVVSIDSEAFRNCQKLTDITIPEGVTTIEAMTFCNCRGLTSVTIPNSVITIGPGAFISCRNATSIVLGNNVARIANQAFDYCSSLASIVIPASVTEIGSWAFENCSSLTEIVFEGDAPSIVLSAFNGINATAKYPAANTTWNEDTLLNYGGSLTWEAYSLSEDDITSGSCGENVTWVLDENGLLTISGTGAMYDYSEERSPFYDSSDIIHVVIEDGVTTIGDRAFECCWELESVSIPNTVTTIGRRAFGDCCDLREVTIPASVTTLRPWVFSCCDSLRKIVFEGNAPVTDGSFVFENLHYSACAYYPVTNPTWTKEVMNSYGEGVQWIPYRYYADEATFTGMSLSLNGDIGVNFYMNLAEELLADEALRMVFTVNGETREVPLADALPVTQADGSIWYRFSCSMAAKEMSDGISAQMYDSYGAIAKARRYGVSSYYFDICQQFDREEKPELFAMVEAMLNYGAAAQEYFGYNTDDLANAAVSAAVPENVDASAYAAKVTGSDPQLSYAGLSLVLESNTALRVFFRATNGADLSDYIFTVNGQPVTPVEKAGLWYIELTDIAAKDLDTTCYFTAGGITVQCSALSYVHNVLQKADMLNGKLVSLCKALFAYSQTADAYFATKN